MIKHNRRYLLSPLVLLAASLCIAQVAAAADSPWLGTWKLDRAQSKLTGDTTVFSKKPNGMYHYAGGGADAYDFAMDGKPYPRAYGLTSTWTQVDEHTFDTVNTVKGVDTKLHRVLSADGKSLTLTATGTKPDGSALNDTTEYKRVSGTTGLVGTWRDVKTNSNAAEVMVTSSPSTGVYHWEYPEFKSYFEGKFDGSELTLMGPTVGEGSTGTAKFASPRKLVWHFKYKGKDDGTTIETLSADGKTITDVAWFPGKEKEKSTTVYVKQ